MTFTLYLKNYFDIAILDLYENRTKGIFKILDDTIKMQSQTTAIFVQNLFANWANSPTFAVPKTQKFLQNDGFIIRHYVGDVLYNVVRL